MRARGQGEDTRELGGPRQVAFRRCRISVTMGPDTGRGLETDRPLVRVGTAADNDLVLTDAAVSRHHLSVVKRGGEFAILDEGSTNGTWVGEIRVKEAVVRQRGEIQVGDTVLLFEPLATEIALEPSSGTRLGPVVGRSPALRAVLGALERVAPTDLAVLIEGETGTGKSLIAETLHETSDRRGGPFVAFDCGALPASMTAGALFGAPDGSYRGAFEEADGGTLLLDRVEALEPALQVELLATLERGEVRAGGRARRVDVRLVASSVDLGTPTDEGRFRAETFYRLAVVRLDLPPLRARPEDLPPLVDAFFERHPELPTRKLERSAWTALERHTFPGNVRELMNALLAATTVADGAPVTARELTPALGAQADPRTSGPLELPDASMPFKDAKARVLDAFERRYLVDLLARNAQNISRAAREAGIDRRHLYRLLDKYGLDPEKT